MIAGAIFAGGAARRFGSDKAVALIDGIPMIDHVAMRLRGQCAMVMVVGREWPGLVTVEDRPRPGMGPLGALAGALIHAGENGFDLVLTSGCDLPDLPRDLVERLAPGPAVAKGQPLLGLWPSALGSVLVDWLAGAEDLSMRAWVDHVQARRVELEAEPTNINRPEDLEAWLAVRGQFPNPSC
jgi:molybdopterin-guanine dinucleotide biosynthesis protein A